MKYYVYQYVRDDGSPYYIGKGKDKRAWQSHRRVNGTQLLPKDKTKIKLIAIKLSESEAYLLEKKLIQIYGRKDLGTGILRNVSDGGEGSSGVKQSPGAVEKRISQIRGRIKSQEEIQKIIDNHRTKKPGYVANMDHLLTADSIAKRSGHNNYQAKPGFKYNSMIFSWQHKETKQMVTMKHLEFYTTYNLNSSNVVKVIVGKRKSVAGWELIK